MGRGRSNPETVAAQRQVERNQQSERRKSAGDHAVGKGSQPGFGTKAWAKEHDLWKEGDTSGPAPR